MCQVQKEEEIVFKAKFIFFWLGFSMLSGIVFMGSIDFSELVWFGFSGMCTRHITNPTYIDTYSWPVAEPNVIL